MNLTHKRIFGAGHYGNPKMRLEDIDLFAPKINAQQMPSIDTQSNTFSSSVDSGEYRVFNVSNHSTLLPPPPKCEYSNICIVRRCKPDCQVKRFYARWRKHKRNEYQLADVLDLANEQV